MTQNHSIHYSLQNNRKGWLQLIKGQIKLNDLELIAGDGAAIENETIDIHCIQDSELLFFDLDAN